MHADDEFVVLGSDGLWGASFSLLQVAVTACTSSKHWLLLLLLPLLGVGVMAVKAEWRSGWLVVFMRVWARHVRRCLRFKPWRCLGWRLC